jgi:protein-S-isoprenylcysteine O-methyltransferase Ste14
MTANDNTSLRSRVWQACGKFLIALIVLMLLPAWTLDYWQAWLYWLLFAALMLPMTLYFLEHDPALVERRMAAGPGAEKEKSQKIIMTLASICIVALFVVPGLDHLFGWSAVPTWLVLVGDLGFVAGYLFIFVVLKENSYASATIETGRDQPVIATGPYAFVRHPMYSGALLMFGATPLALGSYWGLLLVIPLAAVLAWRLIDEERFLIRQLRGYVAYRQDVRYRLIPGIW